MRLERLGSGIVEHLEKKMMMSNENSEYHESRELCISSNAVMQRRS